MRKLLFTEDEKTFYKELSLWYKKPISVTSNKITESGVTYQLTKLVNVQALGVPLKLAIFEPIAEVLEWVI